MNSRDMRVKTFSPRLGFFAVIGFVALFNLLVVWCFSPQESKELKEAEPSEVSEASEQANEEDDEVSFLLIFITNNSKRLQSVSVWVLLLH